MVLFFCFHGGNKTLKTAFLAQFTQFFYFHYVFTVKIISIVKMFQRLWNDLERFRLFAGMVRAFARVCMVFAWVGLWQLVAYRCRARRSLRRVLPR